ncbi:unnamed protein product, partial [Polarella glacialis]
MPPPASRDAAHRAGIRAARQASDVFKAVVQGPQAPAPAGYGVELLAFQKALPRFGWKELVDCSNHFGQRGQVIGELAAELAAEVGRRLKSQAKTGAEEVNAEEVANRVSTGANTIAGLAAASASAARSMSAREVTLIVYSFSKLTPQLPEYALLYDAVADGLKKEAWQFNRLQAALVSTALADVERGLKDALPAVLQPVLGDLTASEEVREAATVDELRFLVHSSAKLERPISAPALEALADCTKRHLQKANFAALAHLSVSWLRLRPPVQAKEAHIDTLRAACVQLLEFQKSHFPAHPLPAEGLAPALADLMAREAERNAPPLTPPAVRDIAKGLVQISWGLQRYQSSGTRGRSLGIDDWSEILQLIVGFCEAHNAAIVAGDAHTPSYSSSSRSQTHSIRTAAPGQLPAWAAEVLYHVLWRAQQQLVPSDGSALVELQSLLTLLRLVRRHGSKPAPDPAFFSWATQLVAAHHRLGNADPGLIAEVISELVPMVPKEERGNLGKLWGSSRPVSSLTLQVSPAASAAATIERQVQRQSSPRLLSGYASHEPTAVILADVRFREQGFQERRAARRAEAPGETSGQAAASPWDVSETVAALLASRQASPSESAAPSVALAAQAAVGGRLWGMLALHSQAKAPCATRLRSTAPAGVETRLSETETPGEEVQVTRHIADRAEVVQAAVASAATLPGLQGMEDMQRLLQTALLRVEALETKLQGQEERRENKQRQEAAREVPKEAARTRKMAPQNFKKDAMSSMQDAIETGGGWLAGIFPSPAERIELSPAAVRRFDFDQYRQSNSARLQAERLRVIVPPDQLRLSQLQDMQGQFKYYSKAGIPQISSATSRRNFTGTALAVHLGIPRQLFIFQKEAKADAQPRMLSGNGQDKMGNSKSQPVAGFSDINANMPQLEARVGRISISGRYHRLPKKLEDHYEVATKILGSGYNGVVRQATNKSSSSGGQKYAVKAFKYFNVAAEKKAQLQSEIEIFLCMDHPHITRLYDVYESDDYMFLVMECMEGGEVFDRVSELKRFSELDAADTVRQMLLALNYIHSHG